MIKAVLHFDLDNTLIYSKKYKQFANGKCIEKLNGQDFGFISDFRVTSKTITRP